MHSQQPARGKARLLLTALAFGLAGGAALRAQTAPAAATPSSSAQTSATPAAAPAAPAGTGTAETTGTSASGQKVVTLSPFQVNTSEDKGYRATNSISGTSLNTPIKDLPIPIEVITQQFIEDTGATDLRQALRYSAGVLLQTQNDQGNNAYHGAGGVNNPQGVTADPSQTYIKIRGFVTDTVLRDGFRRQNSTDSINISRIEVVRGPAALLYGIGDFGGIVNYLPKQPEDKMSGEADFIYGSWDLMRATLDQTGPISPTMNFDYRLTAAVENSHDWTQYYSATHYFVSPVISFDPTPTTHVVVDLEHGESKQKGTGFQQVRSVAGVGINNDQNEHAGLFVVPGTNPRTFRWSGPDTYLNEQASNLELKVTQRVGDHLNLLLGYNKSKDARQQLDVLGNLNQNVGPAALQATVNLSPIDPTLGDSSLAVQSGPTPFTILQYTWNNSFYSDSHDQVRAEANFGWKWFQSHNKWLHMENNVLAGHSEERNETVTWNSQTVTNQYDYKSPTDTSPIRFGTQGDGTPDAAMAPYQRNDTTAWDAADYFIYEGRLLDDRVLIISGMRHDKNDLVNTFSDYTNNTINQVTRSPTQTQKTYQNGVSVAITKGISIYALKAGGLEPNFAGNKDGNGVPIGATTARSRELGIKVDLLDGKISASIGKYRIVKEGAPIFYWWAPSPNGHPKFNGAKDIVYNISNFTPTSAVGGSNGGNGAQDASLTQWNAALAAGAAYQKSGNWYLDATNPAGAAYLNSVFAYTEAHGDSWPGWLYNQDANTNNATMDWAASNGTDETGTTESHGWDGQLLFTPNNNLQVVLSYAYTRVLIDNPGNFVKYPYPQDKWAVWYFPNTDWGLTNRSLTTMYKDPNDTSTWTGIGWGAGLPEDDTPKHHVDAWANYTFTEGVAKGLSAGLGGWWESPRQYLSGITHGGGQAVTDKNGNPIFLSTSSRYDVDMMVKYAWKLNRHPVSLQLNINNLLDDQKLYGLLYSNPRSMRLEFDYQW